MGQNNAESQFVGHNANLHKQRKSNMRREGLGVSVLESSAARAQRLFDPVSGHLLSTLSYCSSTAARALTSQGNGSHLFLHWDETPGQKERVCAGDADVWQLCSKSRSHLLSRQ